MPKPNAAPPSKRLSANSSAGRSSASSFANSGALRLAGRLLWFYQASGIQQLVRDSGILNLFPQSLRVLEAKTPVVKRHFSPDLIAPEELPGGTRSRASADDREVVPPTRYRVGLLTGCVQDLVFSDVNRDTADVLLANDCTVVTPALARLLRLASRA